MTFFMFYIVSSHRKLVDFKTRSGGRFIHEWFLTFLVHSFKKIRILIYDPTIGDKIVETLRFLVSRNQTLVKTPH